MIFFGHAGTLCKLFENNPFSNEKYLFFLLILFKRFVLKESVIIQVNLIITLSLGSMKTDRIISEPCYNEVIYNRHIAK